LHSSRCEEAAEYYATEYPFDTAADGSWSCPDAIEFWKTSGEAGGCCA